MYIIQKIIFKAENHIYFYKMSNNNYLLNIKTVQASTIKLVIDAMKEILMDVNLEFDDTGMKIIALDNTHIVLIHLKLDADKFEKYYCEKKLFVGINGNHSDASIFARFDQPHQSGYGLRQSE